MKEEIIEWDLILNIPEFSQNLELSDFIELSSISKVFRQKLKPRVLRKIIVSYEMLSKIPNYFENLEVSSSTKNKSNFLQLLTQSITLFNREKEFKSKKIKPFLLELESQFKCNSEYAKELNIYSAKKSCFYIFPLIQCFEHLAKLSITGSVLNLKHFISIIGSLNGLQSILLDWVTFISFPEDKLTQSDIKLPDTLEDFSYAGCSIATSDIPKRSYDFIFNNKCAVSSELFDIYPQSFKNLKNLKFESSEGKLMFNNDWLKLNPKLQKLNIRVNFIEEINFEYIANSKDLKYLIIEFNSIGNESALSLIPSLSSIQYLEISTVMTNPYTLIRSVCKSCPNLNALTLNSIYYIEEFITRLEAKLTKLKVLALKFSDNRINIFKVPILINIRKLKLYFGRYRVESFVLPNSLAIGNLKLITIKIPYPLTNFELFANYHSKYTNWKLSKSGEILNFKAIR